ATAPIARRRGSRAGHIRAGLRPFRAVRSRAAGSTVAHRHRAPALPGRAAAANDDEPRGDDAGHQPATTRTRGRGLAAGAAFAPRSGSRRSRRGAKGSHRPLPYRGNVVQGHRGGPRGADGHGDDVAPSRSGSAQDGAGRRALRMSRRADEHDELSSLLKALPAPEPSAEFLAGARRRYLEAIEARDRRAVFTGLAAAVVGLVAIATLLTTTIEPAALVAWLAEAVADLARW